MMSTFHHSYMWKGVGGGSWIKQKMNTPIDKIKVIILFFYHYIDHAGGNAHQVASNVNENRTGIR